MANFIGMKYPIVSDSAQGYFSQVTGNDTIKSDLLILLLTSPGERIMLPSYGTGLRQLLFQQNNSAVESQATGMINTAISTWEPRAVISQLTATAGSTTDDPTQNLDPVLTITAAFSQFDNLQNVDNLVLELPLG